MPHTKNSPARLRVALAATLAVVATGRTALAQSSPADSAANASHKAPVAKAHVISRAPVIDGKLNEDAWRQSEPFTGFVQRELQEGAPVSERTEVRILTDGDALYVGAWLYDREPGRIVRVGC